MVVAAVTPVEMAQRIVVFLLVEVVHFVRIKVAKKNLVGTTLVNALFDTLENKRVYKFYTFTIKLTNEMLVKINNILVNNCYFSATLQYTVELLSWKCTQDLSLADKQNFRKKIRSKI